MKHFKIVRAIANAALASLAACNGQLAIEDGSGAGSAGYATGGSTSSSDATAGQATGGHAGVLLPGPQSNTPEDKPPNVGSSANASNCPESLPDDESVCGVGEGQYCTYLYDRNSTSNSAVSQSCGCWLASGGSMRWDCGQPRGAEACPDAQPSTGSDCFGMRGVSCSFPPHTECDCMPTSPSANTMTWQCTSTAPERGSASGPAGVDATKPVAELTDAERSAWCGWYADAYFGAGAPDVPDNVDANGYAGGGWTVGARLECLACLPAVSRAECAANLALSTCEAPVGALTDCTLTILDFCTPAPHGCAPYFDAPNCDGTMLVARPADVVPTTGNSSCSIRVR
ncbi:MAG TPA: hypothetical protein VLJ38_16665 [Polyangiaceae bacterium]|nr:hypothetical protein [Polyangiaceae bacterium]